MHILVLGRVQGALGFQYCEQVFGTGLVAAFSNLEGGLGLLQFFALPFALLVETRDAAEGFFYVGKAVDDRTAIGLQQFILARAGLVAFST